MRSRATSGIAGATPAPANVSMVTSSKLIASHRLADDGRFFIVSSRDNQTGGSEDKHLVGESRGLGKRVDRAASCAFDEFAVGDAARGETSTAQQYLAALRRESGRHSLEIIEALRHGLPRAWRRGPNRPSRTRSPYRRRRPWPRRWQDAWRRLCVRCRTVRHR